LLAVLLTGVSLTQKRLNRIRLEEKLTDVTPLKNAPPMVAFTTMALGGFRGLLADYLWLRAQKMQEKGNYFELVQLGSWIVKLQPRFTGASSFLAWNMAYNISVTFNSFEDRWRWVQRGIELIRDEALEYNPGDPELYRELGWIFQHKLGQDLDDANRFYKTEMAKDLTRVFGSYPPDWQALARAPSTPEAFRKALGPDSTFWALLKKHKLSLEDFEEGFRQKAGLSEVLAADLKSAGLIDRVELYLRNHWLQQSYKLKPAIILDLNARYGNLDWRLPQAQAIYWASLGLDAADEKISLSCDRMIFQAINAAFKGGRLVYMKEAEYLEITPNIELVDATNQAYLDAGKKHGERIIKGGYENFLVDATVLLYTFGQRKKAAEYLAKGRKRYGNRFGRDLDQFALKELASDMASATQAQGSGTVRAYLFQACHALAIGDYDRAVAFENIARLIWKKYMDEVGEQTHKRRGLPPFSQMKRNVVLACQKSFPPALVQSLNLNLQQAPAPKSETPDLP
jgi:hypothetical protein